VPFGLIGAAALPGEAGDDIVAWVIGRTDRGARRIFGSAAGFAREPLGAARPGRVETAIAVLLLGPPEGFDREAYFREVYGFPFRRELHRGPLEMLFHRVRKTCGDAMSIDRADERIVARILRPIVVADPRCAKPLDDRLLRALAEQPEGSARDVAGALGVPLRTVQAAIKRLADDGACVAERQGRNIVYRVEDTTFSEPTSRAIRRTLE
jgi:DNA-binding transcriptional ArsR family regulator